MLILAGSAISASATTIALGLSTQKVIFTALGANDPGQGQSRVTWGNCSYDGTNKKCLVTGPFTGLAGGGTYNFIFTYAGNGISPLIAVSRTPGDDLIFFNIAPGAVFSLVMTIVPTTGPTTTFYDSTAFSFTFSGATCTGITDCRVGAEGVTIGSTISGPITGLFDATPMIRSAMSASEFGAFPAIAPGTWMEIYGTNLATIPTRVWGGADFNGVQAPTALSGTTVTVAGKPAYIDFVSPGQVNAQVPSGVPTGPQPLVVTTAGGSSAQTMVTVNAVEPGLLAPRVFNVNAGQYAAALFPDGVTFVLPPGFTSAVPTRRAKAGDTITLYGVGFGSVTPDIPAGQIVQQLSTVQMPFKVFFSGIPATVNYSGLVQGFLGLYQFNVVVPTVPASDTVPVTFSVGEVTIPQPVLLPVQ